MIFVCCERFSEIMSLLIIVQPLLKIFLAPSSLSAHPLHRQRTVQQTKGRRS
jgi:hypothetical protein